MRQTLGELVRLLEDLDRRHNGVVSQILTPHLVAHEDELQLHLQSFQQLSQFLKTELLNRLIAQNEVEQPTSTNHELIVLGLLIILLVLSIRNSLLRHDRLNAAKNRLNCESGGNTQKQGASPFVGQFHVL